MENEQDRGAKKCGCGCSGCGEGGCWYGAGWCGHGNWKHALMKIVVAIFIFWCGVQFGALRSYWHGGYGMMNGYGTGGSYYGQSSYGPGMMNWQYYR